MRVLSLFDGMSCGRAALERGNIPVSKYYASEIDKYAINISQKNYPDIIQLGDILDWHNWDIDWANIDLIIGGSPCQGFSFAGKQLNFEDPRSKLFFVFVDILNHIKSLNPGVKFLLENVRMKKEFLSVITAKLGGVEPVLINSALVSAQNRQRYYWTNIGNITQPSGRGIMLKDIVHENTDKLDVSKYIVPFDTTLKILDKEVEKGKVGYFRKDSQANRIYYIHDKAVTLCGDAGGGAAKMGQYLFGNTKKNSQGDRVYSENEKASTLNASSGGTAGKGNLLFGCLSPDRINKRQNGQRFNQGQKFYTLTAQDKHGVLIEGYIRKLTPIEGERLQTLPDNFTEGVSDSQRYKMLGNGWTIDVIAHIFNGLKA